jgi:anti-sigma B factor antagonist
MNIAIRPTLAYALRHWDAGPTRPHVVVGSGEFDLQAAPELRQLLCELSDLGTRDIVLDFTEVTFVDSTILGVLLGHLKRVKREGRPLSLVCTARGVRRTIQIAGLEAVLHMHSTLTDALASAGS